MRINIPPVTRALLLLTVCFSLLYGAAKWNAISTGAKADSSVAYLTLVPSKSIFYPWTILTSTFVEQNVLNLLINTTAVYFGGRYLERAWGSREFAIVVLVATLIPNLLVVPTYWLWGVLMRNTTRADTPIAGAITLQACFLVAFKQLVPEHTVSLYKGLIKVRVKHFPAMFLLLNTIGGVALGTDTALLLAWYGLVSTYVYLRFFKSQLDIGSSTGGGKTIGDASETFAFTTFFPQLLQPPVTAICDQIYRLCCKIKLVTPFSDEAVAISTEQAAARSDRLPTVDNVRAAGERRRQLALRALDERLNASSNQVITTQTPGEPVTNERK